MFSLNFCLLLTVEQGYTIAIIKPNIVAEGNVDKIIEEVGYFCSIIVQYLI